jgi:hypothetical protein
LATKNRRAVSRERQAIENYVNWQLDFPSDPVFLRDAYHGTGGFKTGDYLVPHPRETQAKYDRRRFMAYYTNYVRPCVDSFVNPIFKEAPVREYTANKFFEAFLENVDSGGSKINRWMKQAALKAKLYGGVLAVLDNFSERSESQADALQNRRYPYLYLVRPEQVTDWAVDRFGNLSKISYKLTYTDIVNGNKVTRTDAWTWTADAWACDNQDGHSEGENTIHKIPVVPLYGALQDNDDISDSIVSDYAASTLFPQSAYYQIARCNLAIFNACSELRERNRNQAFSILAYPIGEGDDYEVASEVTAGSSNMLLYRGGAGQPGYIDPASTPSDVLLNEIANIVQEIYRMAERANVTGVQTQNSGLAKEWDNNTGNQTIADFANNLEEFEARIAELFGLYIGADLAFTVKYNKEYGPVDTSAELDKATKALSLQTGGKFDTEVRKQAARSLFHSYDDSQLNDVLKDIDAQPAIAAQQSSEEGDT